MSVANLKSHDPGVVPLSRSVYAARLAEFPDIALPPLAHRGRWRDFFRQRIGAAFNDQVIFEIGCFHADFLSRVAARHPTTGFVGLDWKCKAIYDGARRITELGLRNVALIRGRGQDVARLFAPRELDEIWVLHPDPCDRPAELKNRLIAEPFLMDAYATVRDAGSRLVLKTDHAGYFRWVRELLASSSSLAERFAVTATSTDFWNDPAALAQVAARPFAGEVTTFERRFTRKRQPIHYFEIARK